MPEWKLEIERHLAGLHIDPAGQPAIIEELSQHLEDCYQECLAAGADQESARRSALSELSNPKRLFASLQSAGRAASPEAIPVGDSSTGKIFSDFTRDLRYAGRSLRKNFFFTFFAVLTLSLGIGANATVFTIINTLLLHPLPVSNPSRLVAVYSTEVKTSKQSGSLLPVSFQNLSDYKARNQVFSGIAGFTPPLVLTLTGNSTPQRLFGELTTAGYFETLGLRPALGRFFQPDEINTPGSAPVAVLSYAAWKGRFGGAPDILGRRLRINEAVFTVIGVAPEGFIGISPLFGPDVWLPATMAEQVLPADLHDVLKQRAKPFFQVLARLKPGTARSQAEADLRNIAAGLEREYPSANDNRTAAVRPITDELFSTAGGQNSMVLVSIVLLVIVGLVLLIACSNVANLLLARAAARRHEIAVRLSIGASRGRIVRQLLTECVLLGLLGGLAGLAIGYEGCRFLWSFRPPEVIHNLVEPRLDINVFGAALLVALVTAFVFGLVPALRASKADVLDALKQDTRTAGRSRRAVTFGNLLLVGQVALSLVALITAALFLRSVQRAYQIDPGFQTGHLAVFMMNPGQAGYDHARTETFYREIRDRVSRMPGVVSMSWSSSLPFWARASRQVSTQGHEQLKKSEMSTTLVNTVDTDYFSTMGISLLEGRDFTPADRDTTVPVAVINETLAGKYWPKGGSIGQRIQLSDDKIVRQIVGVVKTANYTTLGEAAQPAIYLPFRQNFLEAMNLYVRTQGDPAGALLPIQHEIRAFDPKIEVSDARTGAKLVGQVLWMSQIGVALLAVFGLLALTLASVGLYGAMAYSVNRRRRELGLRMALGAGHSSVLRLVLGQGMSLVGIGVAIGLTVSLFVGRALSSMLFGLSPADPLSLMEASLVLVVVALLACYLPARSASRVDPMIALRDT
jgi:predicted permease